MSCVTEGPGRVTGPGRPRPGACPSERAPGQCRAGPGADTVPGPRPRSTGTEHSHEMGARLWRVCVFRFIFPSNPSSPSFSKVFDMSKTRFWKTLRLRHSCWEGSDWSSRKTWPEAKPGPCVRPVSRESGSAHGTGNPLPRPPSSFAAPKRPAEESPVCGAPAATREVGVRTACSQISVSRSHLDETQHPIFALVAAWAALGGYKFYFYKVFNLVKLKQI